MLETSFGLLIFMRKLRNYKKGLLPIYLKITVNGEAKELRPSENGTPLNGTPGRGVQMETRKMSKN